MQSIDNNDKIFNELGLDKYAVCTKCYGYDAGFGSFPVCADNDYAALTRLVDYLQQKCKEYNSKYTMSPQDFKDKPKNIAPDYAQLAKAIEAWRPTPSLLSETTLLTRRKSNTCKF